MFLKFLLCILMFTTECFSNEIKFNATDDTSRLAEEIELGIWVPRVVNGKPAKLGEVPYQIAMKVLVSRTQNIYKTFCGATLVGPSKMITAAHCFEESGRSNCHKIFNPGKASSRVLRNRYAVAGNLFNTVKYSSAGGQWRSLSSVIYPKKYSFPKFDIALAYAKYPFKYNDYVSPIPYAKRNTDYIGKCLVSGYGRTGHSKYATTEVLLVANLEILPKKLCDRVHRKNMDKFICTSSSVSDVGKGDSGGPLVCKNTGDPNEKDKGVLVGVVSGHTMGRGSFFTRVSKYSGFVANDSVSLFTALHYWDTVSFMTIAILYKTFLF